MQTHAVPPIHRCQSLCRLMGITRTFLPALVRWSPAKTIIAGFLASLLILVLIGTVSVGSIVQLISCSQTDRDALRAMTAMSDLSQALSEAESGERGYLLTGDEQYLEPYRR